MTASGTWTDRLARCAPLLARYAALSGAPHVAVAITDAQQTIAVLGSGAEDPAQQPLAAQPVPIGSITKPLAALALLREAGRRGVALDAPVARFLPAFAGTPWRDATLAELLTHTAGLSIGSLTAPWSRRDLRAGLALPRFDDLRGRFSYSNLGYEALGQVLERLAERPLGEVLEQQVLQPLGMAQAIGRLRDRHRLAVPPGHIADAGPALHWVGEPLQPAPWEAHLGAAGGSAASLHDLAAMLRALLAAPGGGGPLADAWRTAMAPRVPCQPGVDYGLGLFVDRTRGSLRVHHAGGVVGHRTLAMADVDHQRGVAVLTDLGGPLRGSLILRLGHALLDTLAGDTGVRVDHPQVPAQALTGTFHACDAPADTLRFGGSEDAPWVALPGGIAAPLQWTETDRALARQAGWQDFEFRLERGQGGRIERVQHGGRVFTRSAAPAPVTLPQSGLSGLYRCRNPWAPMVQISEGPCGPMAHVAPLEGPLLPLQGRAWRLAGTPEVIAFGPDDDGTFTELDLSGALYARDDG